MFKRFIFSLILTSTFCLSPEIHAQESACAVQDKLCLMQEIEKDALTIQNAGWRDKTFRELAKSYTYDGYEDKAIALIEKIDNADTKAMTIRGIGFAAADRQWPREKYTALFEALTLEANKIEHPPSQAIAYTYIAMAQAFARDDAGAAATAQKMTNDALRNKAYAETAEIQAERGDINAAFTSIQAIDSVAFKNKAYATVAKIFIKQGDLTHAYMAAQRIDNTYNRLQILQNILNHGTPEENML